MISIIVRRKIGDCCLSGGLRRNLRSYRISLMASLSPAIRRQVYDDKSSNDHDGSHVVVGVGPGVLLVGARVDVLAVRLNERLTRSSCFTPLHLRECN